MKKVENVLIILLLTILILPINVEARTLKDYKNDLNDLIKQKETAQKNEKEMQKQIDKANEEIEEITKKIKEALQEEEEKEKEIEELEIKISSKEQELKDLAAFYQVSNSENFYLKYLFGAESFTDFIYRFSVINQLVNRNDELVKEMNDLVAENELKIKELNITQEELNKSNQEVNEKLSKFADQKSKYSETYMDIDSQIKTVQEKIKKYEDLGCGENEELSVCTSNIPFDFGFDKPLKSGYINDEFGMRYHPIYEYYTMHRGIDIGGNKEGTPVYAAAAGRVVDVTSKYYCGGNIVTINHVINGVSYTTRYWHLLKTVVKDGDIVEKGDQVGTVGGGSTSYINGGYDQCTNGTHLHFEMAKGHYYGTSDDSYSLWSTYTKKVFNPREMVYFPKYGKWW